MLKQCLSGLLGEEEIGLLHSSFDVIGDIAVIKIPPELSEREQIIADTILAKMKNVRTVLKQDSPVRGEFRTREVSYVSGEKKFTAIYKENQCLFKVDVSKVYFSPRLSTERKRIASLVKEGERILNMFAGIGSFSIVIAKRVECLIESVDNNPVAYELAIESLKLNKRMKGTVKPILSDALEYTKRHKGSFDRVLMPLPERSWEFLPAAIASLDERGSRMIHYYVHVSEEQFKDKGWIHSHLGSIVSDKRFDVLLWKKVREVGPRYIQAVADILVS